MQVHSGRIWAANNPAGGSAQALALFEAAPERYDAMLLDRMMSVPDGLNMLARVKADARFRHLPVIMQTATASPTRSH